MYDLSFLLKLGQKHSFKERKIVYKQRGENKDEEVEEEDEKEEEYEEENYWGKKVYSGNRETFVISVMQP